MTMFIVVVAVAFAAMALVPPAGAAFAILGDAADTTSVSTPAGTRGGAETPRNIGLSESDIACGGQVWGEQTPECLATIAKDAGRTSGRPIRVITGA